MESHQKVKSVYEVRALKVWSAWRLIDFVILRKGVVHFDDLFLWLFKLGGLICEADLGQILKERVLLFNLSEFEAI